MTDLADLVIKALKKYMEGLIKPVEPPHEIVIPAPALPAGWVDHEHGIFNVTEPGYGAIGDGNYLAWLPNDLSDGGSIPALARPFLGPNPCFNPAWLPMFFFHDGLYLIEGYIEGRPPLTRHQIDSIFYWQLVAGGAKPELADLFFQCVRAGGGIVWGRHTPESVANARQYFKIFPNNPTT